MFTAISLLSVPRITALTMPASTRKTAKENYHLYFPAMHLQCSAAKSKPRLAGLADNDASIELDTERDDKHGYKNGCLYTPQVESTIGTGKM